MLIRIPPSWQLPENIVTPESVYLSRRKVLKSSLAVGTSLLLPSASLAEEALKVTPNAQYKVKERDVTKQELVESYNNFYEFSLEKGEVKHKVANWELPPKWQVEVSGLVRKPQKFDLDDLIKKFDIEERIYRFRCVEAWSMVIPWDGFPLAKLIKLVDPTPEAKYVKFVSYNDPKTQPNVKTLSDYPWPYTEGLTIAEANHPLTMLAVGIFGKKLPKQNGAPVRLVVPWKYGFKNIKSIVKIEFVKEQPSTLWQSLAAKEYGFYANVNPKVDHPRWSQASERVIDGRFIPKRAPTLAFNGYENEVAGLYKGLDLKLNY